MAAVAAGAHDPGPMDGAKAKNGDRTGPGTRPRPDGQRLRLLAAQLAATGEAAFRGTARRYSLCHQDAEDAYQRGLEILITKGPTDAPEELRAWLHTVIKHEALAVRRHRERMLAAGEDAAERLALGRAPEPHEAAAEHQRASQTAEALGQLKPSEVQCMLLKALGYSYDEIAARTGYSWTKVNRSLTEGRRRFFDRFDQIESGRLCQRFAPLLSAASDGEASPDQRRQLQTHLRGCQACRATLRAYRTAPARLAAVLPPVLALPCADNESWWLRLWEGMQAGLSVRASLVGERFQQVAEALGAHKAAAVVASTAALAGGAVATETATHGHAALDARAALEPARHPRPEPASSPLPIAASSAVGLNGTTGGDPASQAEPRARLAKPDGEFSFEAQAASGAPGRTSSAATRPLATGAGTGVTRERVADAAVRLEGTGGFEGGRATAPTGGTRTAGEFGP
jgi:RNA polymerase sigma factor (sigma-70 family)